MKQLLHIIFITCVISGLLLPSPGTTPTASAQEGPVTVTENDTSAWVKYEDVAHGFTILVPPNAQVSPAEALPGSRTRVSLTGLGEADCGVTISFGVFVVDKPVEVDIETWTRPNPNWEEDLIDEGPTDSKGAFSYFQRHSGISDGLQRDVLRAYATRGGKVYFADLEPATSLLAEEAFWAILRSFVFVHSLDKSQPSVLSAYNQEAELVRAPAEPMSSPPPGYAVPIGGDKMITQRPHSAFTHACTGMYWRDCEAIDIEVNIDGHDPIFAPAAGTYIPVQSCYGNTATIYHANGTVTHLGHLDSFGPNIASGFVIQQGEVAGLGGNTFDPSCGKSSGPHVHWVLRDSSNVSVPISGAAGIDLASNLAHGGVTVNYSPSMTWSWPSNVLMFTADQTSLPVSVGTLRSLIVGKGWITTLYRSTGFQNRYATYFGPTSMSLSSLQTRSLRVFDDVCPVDSAPTAESETIEALTTCYAPPPSQVNDNVAFVNDVSVPDGSVLSPGQSFTKTWLVRNTGTSTWGANYQRASASALRPTPAPCGFRSTTGNSWSLAAIC